MIDQKVADYAKGLFREYYRHAEGIVPPNVGRREFGFGDFEKKISYRHLAFRDGDELRKKLVEDAPPFVSYSSAEYERPAARPMENKGWLGSELIFDLDATDLHLPCQSQHGRSWVCGICMGSVRTETVRLIEDFLVPDFGFSAKDIMINFSGNRGYHVHVMDRSVMQLDSKQRRDITEYIAGINISPEDFFDATSRALGGRMGSLYDGPTPESPGWGGKFARSILGALKAGEQALVGFGMDPKVARKLCRNREAMEKGIRNGNWKPWGLDIAHLDDVWEGAIKGVAIKQSDSIDKNVTNDTHHLLRIPNTIHGDTGLAGRSIGSVAELAKFEPMADAIAFMHGTATVRIAKSPELSIGGETFGPYEDKTAELPQYAALYLMLKRVATLA